MRIINFLSKTALTILLSVVSYSGMVNAQPGTYNNPVLINRPDPFLFKFNGWYYNVFSGRRALTAFKSKDLINWNKVYDTVCFAGSGWAPEVIYWNGYFYLYTGAVTGGVRGLHVFRSEKPEGPYLQQTENLFHNFDDSPFIDDDGKWYLTYAYNQHIMATSMDGPYKLGNDVPIPAATMKLWTEGPYLIKRHGKYYLTYCGNHFRSPGYRISVAVSSKSPIEGYVAYDENPLLVNTEDDNVALGHSMNIKGPDLDADYIIYHSYNKTLTGDRRLLIDRIAWNGDKFIIYGPTSSPQVVPSMPDFYDYFENSDIGNNWLKINDGAWSISGQMLHQTKTGNNKPIRLVSAVTAGQSYTAEFNMKETVPTDAPDTRLGFVFSYTDENNFGVAMLNPKTKKLETQITINGKGSGLQSANMPVDYDCTKWHCARIEKSGPTVKIFLDKLLIQTINTNGLAGGKIGYATENAIADFSFIAFTNQVDGSSAYDAFKPVPGILQAVHFNSGGEGKGYHNPGKKESANTFRSENVSMRPYTEDSYAIRSKLKGEWYKYNVIVDSACVYNVDLLYTAAQPAKIRIWVDSENVSGDFTLPGTKSFDKWQTASIKGLKLPKGKHTLRLETLIGGFDLSTLTLYHAENVAANISDNFQTSFSGQWNYSDGDWKAENGLAKIDTVGKRTLGNTGWSDYTVESDVQVNKGKDAGIMFRAVNPANGDANNNPGWGVDFFQGYYAGISDNEIILLKINYNREQLKTVKSANVFGTWHHLKVVVKGNNIKLYVDNMNIPAIDVTDDIRPFTHGKVGLRADYATASFKNFKVY